MSNDPIEQAIAAVNDALRVNASGFHLTGENVEGLRRSVTALRQHQQDGGWRPIDSAPKDGTRIIVWVEHNPKLGHKPEYSHATNAKWIDLNGGGWTWDGLCGLITHWQPLPPAPKKENDDV